MHIHGLDAAEVADARANTTRDPRPDAILLRAAAAGRTDVLGPRGMLAVQRAAGNAGATALAEEQPTTLSGSGNALDDGVRTDMEARLGADFSDVRVHTGDSAHAAASSVDALAYTSGTDIVFQSGQYDPSSSSGQTMLAHELTHVVQQRNGPVDGTDNGAGVSVSSPSDRFEREAVATADRAMSEPAVQRVAETGDQAMTEPAVQRAADGAAPEVPGEELDEEQPAAQTFVQRHGGDMDEHTE